MMIFIASVYVAEHYFLDRSFESKVELLILPKASDGSEQNDANIRLNIQLMNTYMNIMKSNDTLGDVKAELKLKDSIDTLQKNLVVASDENSLSVKLKVTADTPEKAMQIANTIATTTKQKMKLYFQDNKVLILNYADLGKLVSKKIYYVVAGFIGLWVGIMFILAEIIMARVVRDETDIATFDFPILGTIAYSDEERERRK